MVKKDTSTAISCVAWAVGISMNLTCMKRLGRIKVALLKGALVDENNEVVRDAVLEVKNLKTKEGCTC